MRNRIDATTTADFQAGKGKSERRPRLVQPAPGPEAPAVRDKAGAQRGMIIMLLGAVLFWLVVAAAVIYGLH
jgi:hypothetical protein